MEDHSQRNKKIPNPTTRPPKATANSAVRRPMSAAPLAASSSNIPHMHQHGYSGVAVRGIHRDHRIKPAGRYTTPSPRRTKRKEWARMLWSRPATLTGDERTILESEVVRSPVRSVSTCGAGAGAFLLLALLLGVRHIMYSAHASAESES